MTPEQLYETLGPIQEKKGYYFNPDRDWVMDVLEGVLTNKERYGYGSCPCRLATGERERDRDIICPCWYRDEDVAKYERCFCSLYFSREAARGTVKVAGFVPDRWLRK